MANTFLLHTVAGVIIAAATAAPAMAQPPTLCFRFFWLAIVVLLAAAPDPARAMPGDAYISRCCFLGEIDRVTQGGSVSVFATSGLNEPVGLAFDAAGDLFVASSGNNTIEKFTPNGVGTVFASTRFVGPTGLAFDASGNLFAAEGDSIEKYTPSGTASMFANTTYFEPVDDNPWALAFDASGNLFVGSQNGTIDRYTPSGTESLFTWVFPFAPVGLAFDNAGNLLVADGWNGSLLRIAPNGDGQTIAPNSLQATILPTDPTDPFAIAGVFGVAVEPAVSSVPEPAAALLLATSVAGLRLTRRRQRRC
jgi:streptogramin lyase